MRQKRTKRNNNVPRRSYLATHNFSQRDVRFTSHLSEHSHTILTARTATLSALDGASDVNYSSHLRCTTRADIRAITAASL